jgi:hypothetical protein
MPTAGSGQTRGAAARRYFWRACRDTQRPNVPYFDLKSAALAVRAQALPAARGGEARVVLLGTAARRRVELVLSLRVRRLRDADTNVSRRRARIKNGLHRGRHGFLTSCR